MKQSLARRFSTSSFPRSLLVTALVAGILAAGADRAAAAAITWNTAPATGDWNTASNWTPMTVPNNPADTAVFSSSTTTSVALSASVEVNAINFTSTAANPYTGSWLSHGKVCCWRVASFVSRTLTQMSRCRSWAAGWIWGK